MRGGVYEILVEYSTYEGEEILVTSEAGPHIREGLLLKWNGAKFRQEPYPVSDADECFRTGVRFILAVWKRDYLKAYRMAALPQFLGVDGIWECLRASPFAAFVACLDREVIPLLEANLSTNLSKGDQPENGPESPGLLTPGDPAPGYCWLEGPKHLITVTLQRIHSRWKVSGFEARPVERR